MPEGAGLNELAEAARGCRACDLWRRATQTVFGEGADDARLVLVGEQPGDAEDRAGRPFVGPAGRLLERALTEAGIDRSAVYVTNAVKRFKWKPAPGGGKKRIHDKPSREQVRVCRPWLAAELAAVRAEVVVCLGSTGRAAGDDHRAQACRPPASAAHAPSRRVGNTSRTDMIERKKRTRLRVETVADAPEVLALVEELEGAGFSTQLEGHEGSWAIEIRQRAAGPSGLLRAAVPIVDRWLRGERPASVRLLTGNRVYTIDLNRTAGGSI